MVDYGWYKDRDGSIKRISLRECLYLKNNLKDTKWIYIKNDAFIYDSKELQNRIIFVERKNGKLYFRYYIKTKKVTNKKKGIKKTIKHLITIEVLYDYLKEKKFFRVNINGEIVDIYIKEVYIDGDKAIKNLDGSYCYPDLFVVIEKTYPENYKDYLNGHLAIEIADTHPVDSKKIALLSMANIPIIEHVINKDKWEIQKNSSQKIIDQYKQFKMNLFKEALNGKFHPLIKLEEEVKWRDSEDKKNKYAYVGDYVLKIFLNDGEMVIEYYHKKDTGNKDKYLHEYNFYGEKITDLDFAEEYAVYLYKKIIEDKK